MKKIILLIKCAIKIIYLTNECIEKLKVQSEFERLKLIEADVEEIDEIASLIF